MTPTSLPSCDQTPRPQQFPEAIVALVRLFAREAAREAFATRCTEQRGEV